MKTGISLLFIYSICLIGLMAFVTFYFRVMTIHCQFVDGQNCPTALENSLNTAYNESIYFTDFDSLLNQELLLNTPYVIVNIKKHLPHTLAIVIDYETFDYLLKNDQKLVAVTSSGMLVANQNSFDLPIIEIQNSQNYINHDSLDPLLHQKILLLIKSLYKHDIFFQNIVWIDGNELRVVLNSDLELIFDLSLSENTIKQARIILESEEFKNLDKNVFEIDLRFQLPVLRTNE